MCFRGALLVLLLGQVLFAYSQKITLEGKILDEKGAPLVGATVRLSGEVKSSDEAGRFAYILPFAGDYLLQISYVGYQPLDTILTISRPEELTINLQSGRQVLGEVIITNRNPSPEIERFEVNRVDVRAKSARVFPSAFGDFSRVLVTLPGVSSNNELSSGYSVRGGNFDENLVYVNDIPIYRPFLSNAGQQEGLNFVNPDLVSDISFFAGGWEAKYGDKLSSNLLIEYARPDHLEGSVALGLLGGSAYFGTANKSGRISQVTGVRHRDSRYLLNTLQVDGQYFPTYTDFQSFWTFDLTNPESNRINRTTLKVLASYAQNRYLTLPVSQTTDFGSVTESLRIETGFEGREVLEYDTYQAGWNLSHQLNNDLSVSLIGSAVYTMEQENFDVEGAYRLCDIDNNPASNNFDECVSVRGIGSQYDYGRNRLEATILNLENRYEWFVGERHLLEFGAGISYQDITDEINEYSFKDSADFVEIDYQAFNELQLNNILATQYLQWEFFGQDSLHLVNIGLRGAYWSQSREWLISPRMQYQFRPKWKQPIRFNFSAGLYQQPPFYRELRDRQGQVNLNVKAQKAAHFIAGLDYFLEFWDRPFLLTGQVYYKQLYDVIPYEIDNVRLRYYANNDATANAAGFDLRLNGEFIPGTQSWFSLGYLKSSEQIPDDGRGDVRRPLDQRLNMAVFFEDYMPMDSSLRVYVNLVFGSGYPVGPPGDMALRNIFSGDEYYRADIGLSKEFFMDQSTFFNRITARIEVLNALGADNTLSYTWIEGIDGTSFAIPNALSARFFNVKAIFDF